MKLTGEFSIPRQLVLGDIPRNPLSLSARLSIALWPSAHDLPERFLSHVWEPNSVPWQARLRITQATGEALCK